MSMRLDKFLCEMNIGSRSQVKTYIRQGLVTVNKAEAKKPEQRIDECSDQIAFKGKLLIYSRFIYYMLNKPKGVVSATTDKREKTVLDLLNIEGSRELFPVGRLDKDTEGLLLLTNDGELAHNMLSPKKHVDKTYYVTVLHPLTLENLSALELGVDIGDAKPTAPATAKLIDKTHLLLTIHEGRFHQIKRMLKAVNNEVLELKRLTFGALSLDSSLAAGEYRALTSEEVAQLHGA